jgi:hypothetical protein
VLVPPVLAFALRDNTATASRQTRPKELVLQELDRMGEAEFQTISHAVIEEMTSRGELHGNLTSLPEDESKDKVFSKVFERLSQRVLERTREEEARWLRRSAEAALAKDTLAKAARYQERQSTQAEEMGAE